jgi:Cu+-exporting ATPase
MTRQWPGQLLTFSENGMAAVKFSVPNMHCAACIWLLESLPGMQKGILHVYTDFLKKEISVTFNSNLVSLRQVVEKLAEIGYEPELRLSDLQKKKTASVDRTLIYKIGVAGFCFRKYYDAEFPRISDGSHSY